MEIVSSITFRLIVLHLILLADLGYSQISVLQTKGFDSFLPRNKEHLSPLRGALWWQNHRVQNLASFDLSNPDLEGLVSHLFYRPDPVSFLPTVKKNNPATYLDSVAIGRIINQFEKIRQICPNASLDCKKKLTRLITRAIVEDPNIKDLIFEGKSYQKTTRHQKKLNQGISRIERDLSLYKKRLKKKSNPEIRRKGVIENQSKFEKKEKLLSYIKILKEQNNEKIKKLKHNYRDLDLDIFLSRLNNLIDCLVGSFFYCSYGEIKPFYTQNLPYDLLLSFLWAKAKSRNDFYAYFNEVAKGLEDKSFFKRGPSLKNRKSLGAYKPDDLMPWKEKDYNSRLVYFLSLKENHPVVKYEYSTYKKTNQRFADCFESSYRSFLNIIFINYRTGEFDISKIENTVKNIELINYYKKYHNITMQRSQEAREDWADLVSELNNKNKNSKFFIKYQDPFKNPQYNISSGMSNFYNLSYYVLGQSYEAFIRSVNQTFGNNSFINLKFIYNDDHNHDKYFGVIEIVRKEPEIEKKYYWHMEPGHSYVADFLEDESLVEDVFNEELNYLIKNWQQAKVGSKERQEFLDLISTLADFDNLAKLKNRNYFKVENSEHFQLLMSFPYFENPLGGDYFNYVFSYGLQNEGCFSQMTASLMKNYSQSQRGAKVLTGHLFRSKIYNFPEVVKYVFDTYGLPKVLSFPMVKNYILREERVEYFPYVISQFEGFSSDFREYLLRAIKDLGLERKYPELRGLLLSKTS